jgi:hypothetical protein
VSDFIECIESVTKPLRYRTQTVPSETETETETETDKRSESPGVDSSARSISVPFKKIIDLYHETLPELPRVEELTDQRKGYIRQRWQQDLKEVDHWVNYFQYVKKSDFLMGRVEARNGKPPFRATLEWLTRPGNYAKVAEEKYHGEVR